MPGQPGGTASRPPNPPRAANPPPRLYLSYLLRLWSNAGGGERGSWRASLESPVTQEQRHFPDLESLFAFLRAMTEQEPAADVADSTDVMGTLNQTEKHHVRQTP